MPTITLDITPAAAQRIQDALTSAKNMQQPATVADYKEWLRDQTRQLVVSEETRKAREAVQQPADPGPDIT